MSYKCMKCDVVRHDEENLECSCDNPKFIKAATIHYLHPNGPGRTICKQKTYKGIPGTPTEDIVEIKLNQGCNDASVRIPIATQTITQVTCPDCLQFIKSLIDNKEIKVSKEVEEWVLASQPTN